jgi:hypothetical protein
MALVRAVSAPTGSSRRRLTSWAGAWLVQGGGIGLEPLRRQRGQGDADQVQRQEEHQCQAGESSAHRWLARCAHAVMRMVLGQEVCALSVKVG